MNVKFEETSPTSKAKETSVLKKNRLSGGLSGVSIVTVDDAFKQRKSSVQENKPSNIFRSMHGTREDEIKEVGEDDEDEDGDSNEGGLTGKLDHYF